MADAPDKVSFRQYRELLGRYLAPQRRLVLLLGVLMFANLGLQLVNPQILRRFIDSIGAGTALDGLIALALVFVGVALVQQIVSVFESYVAGRVAWTATNVLRTDLARHALSLDMSYHNAHTPGEMIGRVDKDAETMGDFLSTFAVDLLGNMLLLVSVLGLLFWEDWRAGSAVGGFVTISFLLLAGQRDFGARYWRSYGKALANTFGFMEERIGGAEDIRTSGAKPNVMSGFTQLMRTLSGIQLRAQVVFNTVNSTTEFLFGASNAVGLAVGAYLFLNGSITIGTVYLIFHYTNMLRRPIGNYTEQMNTLQQATGSIYRILELTGTRSKITDGYGRPLPEGPLSVSFDRVSFAYHGGDPVLRDLHFNLAPGRTLGLLGRTGRGKTTLSRLLARLYDPGSGTVRLGGVDIRDARVADLRRRVSMVTQEVQIFHGTVRDNLTFFDSSVSDDLLRAGIEELGLSEWLDSIPEGLDTTLRSGGGGLSAGEAQLLAFTRIFLSDAGLVVLDEASSRLDRSTEALVQNVIQRLEQDRTVIIIAHHLATVQRVDEIIILQEGRVLEHGDRAALAGDEDSRFSELLRTGLEGMLV
jgi:ATP-binding cassette subfamily B protein